MLLKCCTWYVNKFGKLGSGHRTGKIQFSSQSQRRVMPKKWSNYHTAVLTSHASKVMLKVLQARLQQYMNKNSQMYKLGLQKAEEPGSKLPTFIGS